MSSLLKRSTAILLFSSALLSVASCRAEKDTSATKSPSPETLVSSSPPFQTREPDRYRATRTITIVTARGGTVVTKSLTARDGEMRRHESETAGKKMVYLDVPQGRFVLLPDDNLYADLANETAFNSGQDEEQLELSPERLLHGDGSSNTTYQKLGTEVINGRNANKYRVVVNSSRPENVSLSETLIWIDEALNMPIKSETNSQDGTRVTMEISEIALDFDKNLFEIPDSYEKVTFTELRKRLKKSD